eukprot:gene58410-79983_t
MSAKKRFRNSGMVNISPMLIDLALTIVGRFGIYIDADACPVKDEVYKVAARYGLKTFVVSNSFMMIPQSPLIERVVVDAGPDIADDWIAERAAPGDVVVTNDIPLADRVLKAGAAAIKPNGQPFTADSIGSALAQ